MSQAFNLTAQINLQAPTNLKTVVAQIRRELGTVSADVKINISGASARNIDNITRRLDAMNAALIQARTNTSSLDTALRSLTTSFSSLQSSSTKTTSGLSNTITTVKQTAKNLQVATTEMEEFGKQSALAIRRFAAFSVVTTGVFALTNAITSGFKAFVEFDKELVKLQQVTGKGVVGLRGLEKEITVLATSLGVSSKSLIEVASTLAQAGLTAEDTRIALAALAKTELAPSFDSLADTTEGAIAALRQFGLQAKDLEKALGSINAVAAAFAVESKDIIAAIQRTGGVFAAASRGVSEGTDALNEFVAVFTSVRATTRESAETIATGLRTIFTRLQRAKTIDQLKEFGVELTDLEGKFVGPFEAVKRLSQALNQLDPRDLRFSSIVEELGGFRQIGKVIPLIQQFATAQEALKVAQKGQGSLTEAQVTAQKSLANQLAKVREQFLALIRDVGKSQTFQGLFKVVTGLASGLISLAGAFKPILPILAIMGAVKGVSAITQFASGFAGGIKKGGGVGSVGSNVGETLSGAKDKEKSDTQQKANTMIAENTSAIKTLTTAMNSLISNIAENTRALASSNSQTLNGGGVVKKFARGGLVPGSGNGDTVPAMLEPGEFVIRKKAVETLGANKLQNINKYATGGPVRASELPSSRVLNKYSIGGYVQKNKLSQLKSLERLYKSNPNIQGFDEVQSTIIPTYLTPTQEDFKRYWWDGIKEQKSMTRTLEKKYGNSKPRYIDFRGPSSFSSSLDPRADQWYKGNAFQEFIEDQLSRYGVKSTSYDDPSLDFFADLDFNIGDAKFVKDVSSYSKPNTEQAKEILSKRLRQTVKDKQLLWNPLKDSKKLENTAVFLPAPGIKEQLDAWYVEQVKQLVGNGSGEEVVADQSIKRLMFGGYVQKFMAGGIAQDVPASEILKVLTLEGAKKASGLTAGEINSLLRKKNLAGKDAEAKQAILDAYTTAIGGAEAAINSATKVGLVGLLPIGYSKEFGPEKLGKKNVYMVARGLGSQYSDIVDDMQQESSSLANKYAEQVQHRSIFGGPNGTGVRQKLVFDFDETLVSGADILGPDGRPNISEYSNRVSVERNLKNGRLTSLGNKLKELISSDPSFIDQTRILTARPQSTVDLLAESLQALGLPYDTSMITGVSNGLGTDIGTEKAKNLAGYEKLIDDNLDNVKKAQKSGKSAFLYRQIEELSSSLGMVTGQANIEGAMIEKMLASLGAPLKEDAVQNRAIDYPDGLGAAAQYFPGIGADWPTEVKRTIDGSSLFRAREEFTRLFSEKFKLGGQVYDLQQSKKFALGGLAEDTESMQALMSGLYGNRSTKNKPSKEYGKITISEEDGMISAGYMKNETRSGYASAYKMRPYLWYVGLSKATGGYGPKLYDILMEAVTEKGAMLTSDRSSVSGDAKGVWDYYFNNRSDVQKTPLKPSDWTVNSSLIDPKLYGKEETWPPKNDPAWVLQTGYSKTPKLINDENVIRGAKKFATGGSVEDTVPALLTPGEFVINKKAAQKIGYSELSKMNKADKIQGYNKGGIVGGIQRFFRGGVAEKDAVRAQGTALTDIKQAEKTFAMIMGQLSKSMRDSIIKNFKGIESVGAGGKTSLGTGFSENTRGQAVFGTQKGAQVSAMGLQIGGKKVSATTDTVAHESGHLADYALGGNKAFASDTAGTFQFELVEKVKKTMEEAFKKAGENADTIEKYLANNKELFAEFFAKASPEVRAIITSTTEAKLGMQKLADHLGDTGYTFAGLEASDIDSSRPKTSSAPAKSSGGAQNIISSMASKITSFFKPNTSTPSSPAASAPPINPWPIDLMPLTTAAKTAAEAQAKAAEQAEYFAAKAKESGQSLNGFAKTLATKVVSKANSLIAELPGKKEDVRMSAIGLRGKVNSDEEVNNAISTFSSKLQAIDLGAGPDKIKAAAEAIAEGIKVGDSFDKIIASSTELKEILDKQYDSAQATEKAFASLSEETGIAADQLKKLIGQDNLRRQEFIQSEQGQRFGKLASIAPDAVQRFANTGAGAALGKAADFASGKGLIASVSKKFGDDIGKSLDTWLGRFGGPMGVLGAGLAILGDQLPKVIESLGMGSSTTAAAAVGGIKGAGQGLASGAVLGAQVAGPIGALIGGITGAVVSGISGAFEAYNDKKLENNLRALDKASSDLEIAFKKLDSSASEANFTDAQLKFNATIGTMSDVAKQANLGASGVGRAITETLRGLDPTGLISSLTGEKQEGESRQATINAVTKAIGDADKLGSVRLNKVSTSSITDFLDSVPALPERLAGEKDADYENRNMGVLNERRTQLARANQGYQTLKDSGMSEEAIFLSRYAASQQQAGKSPAEISKELGDPKKREEAIQKGKELLAVEGELALKQAVLSRSSKDLAVATEQLLDVYRRAQAGLDRYGAELAEFESLSLSRVSDLTGNASIQQPNRSSERVLGNISAYSMDDVKKAADETSRLAGGGDAGNKLKNDVITAKILRDELPKALRNTSGNNVDDVIDQLEEGFKNAGVDFSDSLRTQLTENLESKTAGRQNIGLSDLADDSSILDNLLKGTEAGLKFAQDIQAKYNDTIGVAANLMNKYNDVLSEAEENQRKAVNIRLNAELDLAKALGRSPTLKELNNPIDTEIKGLTQSVIPGGTTDPAKIAAELQNIDKSIAAGESRLKNPTLETYGAKNQAELDDAIGKDIQALGKQKKALNDGTKALEKLANDGTKAANALSKIQSRQQTSQNATNIAQKLLTSDETELADFTRQMQAYTKTIGGGASRQELGSLQFRRDAFGGLENIKSVLPENIANKMQATLTRQMLSANPEGNRILQQQVGMDEDGNPLTLDQALSNVEGGKLDPVQQQQIDAYNAAVQAQVDAANALGDRAVQAADILSMNIEQLMGSLGDGVNGIISNLQNILPEAQAAAQGEPTPEVEAEKPTDAMATGTAGQGTLVIPGFDEASKVNTDALIASAAAAGLLMAAVYALKKAFEMFNSGGGIKDKLVDMFSGGSRRKRRRRRSKSKRGSSTRTKSSSDKGKSGSKTKRSRKPKTSSGKPTVKPKVSARGSRGKRRGGGILGTLLGMFGPEVVAGSLPENMQDAAYGAMDAADVALNVKDAAQAVKTAKSGAGVVRGGITAAKAGAGAVGAAAPPLIAANSAISIIDNAVQAAYDPAAYDANMRAKTEAGAQRATERETYGQLAWDSLGGAVQGFVDPAGKIVEGVYTGAGAVSDFAGSVSSGMSADRQERELQRKNKFGLTHTQYAQASDEASARLALQEAQKSNDAEGMLRAQQSIDSLQKNKIDSGARIDNWFTNDKDTANYSKAVEDFMAQKTASTKPQVEPAVTEQAKSATEASTAIQTMSKAAIGFATIVGSGLLTGTLGKTTEGSGTPATSGIMDTVMGFVKNVAGAGSGATSSLGQLLSGIGLGDTLNKNDSSKPIYMDVLQKIADNITGSKNTSTSSRSDAFEELRNANKEFMQARSKIEGVGTDVQMGTPEDLDAFKTAEERLNKAKLRVQSFGPMTSNGGDPRLNMSPGFISAANSAAQSHPAPDAKIERKDGKLHVGNKPYEYSSPTSADPSSLTTMATGPQTSTQTSVQAVEAALPQFSKKQQGRLTSLSARGKARASDDGFRIGRTPEQEDEYQELRKLKLDSDPALKDKMRLAELKRKGKGRASEEGFRIGRTGEEEQEYNTLVANKPKTPYEQMQLSKREAYLSRLNPETRAIMEKKLGISSQDSQNPMTAPPVSTGPVPTSLSTQQVVNDRTSGTPGDRMTTDQTGSGYNITIDESSRQFLEAFSVTLNSFGSYIDKLSAIQLPDSITMKGEHVVDVRISGAAAFEGLKKDFMNMMQVEISNKMAMIWKQTGGKVGEAPTNTVDSNAGSIGQGRV
jgi:ABC-type transporter Mla subunit MlaD